MVDEATAKIEDVNGDGTYQRFYVKKALAGDSCWPFRPGQNVRLHLVETTCDRQALVITPAVLEVDQDATDVEIERTSQEVQQTLKDVDGTALADGGDQS
jgi:hypothetical protein